MTRSPKSQSMTDLIEQYRAFAKRHGQATESGDHKEANKAAEKIAIAYRALQQLGADAQQEIVLQMTDPDPGIRLWSASHSLDFAQHEAQSELTKLAVSKSLLGLSAEMTLREWRAGRLRF